MLCAINIGKLYCWSDNDGWFPYETPRVQAAPIRIEHANSWSAVSGGYGTSCGINRGNLYCWGVNDYGQLGNGSYHDDGPDLPTRVSTSNSWTMVATHALHSCAIDAGALYCWGYGSDGQIGDGSDLMRNPLPVRVGMDSSWSAVATGDSHTCGIKAGELYCWGRDLQQQIGNGPGGPNEVHLPSRLGSQSNWSSVAGGYQYSCAISSGDLYCWGSNSNGQLGTGNRLTAASPVLVSGSRKWSRVALGSAHSCGISNGRMYCWGRDDWGQLGNGLSSNADVLQPEQVGTSSDWEDVSLAENLTCGINLGRIYCWGGANSSANLQYSHEPELVDSRPDWKSIQVGGSEVYGIRDEAIWGWGRVFSDFRRRNGSPGTE